MKKVLIISMKGVGEKTEFAKHFFDEINKLAALFMMYTHGHLHVLHLWIVQQPKELPVNNVTMRTILFLCTPILQVSLKIC